MDFFDVAKQMEIESRDFYTAQSSASRIPFISNIFRFLADEEQRHYQIFDALQKKQQAPTTADQKILEGARNAFAKAVGSFNAADILSDAESIYTKAIEKEQKAVDFYSAELAKAQGPAVTGVLEAIINQERQHVKLFQNLVEFVRRPKQWLENAEFNHLTEY